MIVCCLVSMLSGANNASEVNPDWKLKSFCGYEFGSAYIPKNGDTHFREYFRRTETLEKPFRHFKTVTLTYGERSKKLQSVAIFFTVPDDWTYGMFLMELETVREILSKKYNVYFRLQKGPQEGNQRKLNRKFYTSYDYINLNSTNLSLGISSWEQNVQGKKFYITITRTDILKENSPPLLNQSSSLNPELKKEQDERDKELKRKIEEGMTGGGAEVL